MKISDLVFVGIKGSVVAVSRATGQQAWATSLKGMDFVNVLVENDKIFATCRGEIFCLDPLSGELLWHNPLKGFGLGLATLATVNSSGGQAMALGESQRRSQQAATAAAVSASTVH